MSDPELEEIRAKRLAELQNNLGGENAASKQKAAEERQNQIEETKNLILAQILDQPARARLSTLMIGKPEKGRAVENMLVQMAQTGQIRGKVTESQLISILEQINKQTVKTTSVKFDRRRAALDSDEEF